MSFRRTFAVGDIHGRDDLLKNLLDQVSPDPDKDRVVFLGDYIDRGPRSFEVIEFLLDFRNRHPFTVFLKGNHEEMLLDFLNGGDRMAYLQNGGRQTLESYMAHRVDDWRGPIPERHLSFFESLALYFENDHAIFVHAGLKPKKPLHKQVPEDLLWIREPFIRSSFDFGKPVVFGHTPFQEGPHDTESRIGIDTGAVYGGRLTCLELPAKVFHQAE